MILFFKVHTHFRLCFLEKKFSRYALILFLEIYFRVWMDILKISQHFNNYTRIFVLLILIQTEFSDEKGIQNDFDWKCSLLNRSLLNRLDACAFSTYLCHLCISVYAKDFLNSVYKINTENMVLPHCDIPNVT